MNATAWHFCAERDGRCGAEREIQAGEVPADEMPMCHACGMPMVARRARVKPRRVER